MRTLLTVLAVCLSVAGCGGGSDSGSASGTGSTTTVVTLVSISVTAASPAIPKTFSEQLAAMGTYSDGTSTDITSSVAWSSGDTTVATVNAAGLVSGIIVGTSTIRATSSAISGSATVVITAATLSSIAVTPANLTLPSGLTQQLTATGNYSDGTALNITSSVTWASDNAAMATVDASGVAHAVATGTANIAATFGSISASAVLTATSATLESLAITPTNPSIPSGLTQKLAAIGRYSDGSSHDITSSVMWASSSGPVASIDATGLARGLAAGTSAISATSGAVSASDMLTVTSASIASITITPANPNVIQGLTQQLTATATYSDGASFDFTSVVTWSSSATAVATVTAAGKSSAVSVGSATITATFGGIAGTAALSVSPATLASIALTPAAPSVAKGLSQQMSALGTFSNGTSSDITSSVTWSSSNGSVATVDAAGLVQSVSVGTSTIGATSGTVTANTTLTVIAASLSSITIAPANPSIYRGLTQQFTATGTYSDGTQLDLTSAVSWSSSATNAATISAVGLATPNGNGTSTISATLGAVSANTSLTVTAPPLQTTQVLLTLPANASATQSIAISVSSNAVGTPSLEEIIPASSVCSAAHTCTITLSAPVGSDTFTFTAYDQANTGSGPYSGNILAETIVPYTVSIGGSNQINAQLWGNPASIEITPTSTSYYLIGSMAAGFTLYGTAVQSLNIVGYDADHNAIVGPGTPPYIVSAPSSVVVIQPTSSSPSVYGLQAVAFNVSGTLTVAVPAISVSAPPPLTETSTIATRHRAVYVANQGNAVDIYYDGRIQQAATIVNSNVGGVAVSTSGSIIVPLLINEVDVYAPSNSSAVFSPTYSITSGINTPVGACTDHEDNIYVVNSNGVAMYGGGLVAIPTDYTLDENGPVACAIDTDDSLWVVNGGDSTIVHYPHNSTIPDQYWTLAGGTGESPQSLAIDRSGNLYVSGLDASGVSRARFYPKGSQSASFALVTQQGAQIASSLAVDASGALWVGNFDGSLVYYAAPVSSSSVPVNPGYPYSVGSLIVGIAVTP